MTDRPQPQHRPAQPLGMSELQAAIERYRAARVDDDRAQLAQARRAAARVRRRLRALDAFDALDALDRLSIDELLVLAKRELQST